MGLICSQGDIMEKFIPYEKLSKKKQKELNTLKRNEWNINPVTQITPDKKKYTRKEKHKSTFIE